MSIRPSESNARFWQFTVLVALLVAWHVASRNQQFAFFLGEPIQVAGRIWSWFMPVAIPANPLFPDGLPGNADIYRHLGTTLLETVLAFVIGTLLGLACGLWLALAPTASLVFDPYIKAANSMPRVILAPIFALWFGLGIWSKVALAVTLVFFIVFFNVYQGVREVSPVVLANARMLGAAGSQSCVPRGKSNSAGMTPTISIDRSGESRLSRTRIRVPTTRVSAATRCRAAPTPRPCPRAGRTAARPKGRAWTAWPTPCPMRSRRLAASTARRILTASATALRSRCSGNRSTATRL